MARIKEGYLLVSKDILDFPFETLEQEKAYAIIASYKDVGCYLSYPQWCEVLRCTEPTARKTLRTLQELGFITSTQCTTKGIIVWKTTETPLKNLYPLKNFTPKKTLPHPLKNLYPINNIVNNNKNNNISTTSSISACAQGIEKLKFWIDTSDLDFYIQKQIRDHKAETTKEELIATFYDDDFTVREDVENNQRREVLKHFQSWIPRYLNNQQNGNNNPTRHQGTANRGAAVIQDDRDMLPDW